MRNPADNRITSSFSISSLGVFEGSSAVIIDSLSAVITY